MNSRQKIKEIKTVIIGSWGHLGSVLGEFSKVNYKPDIVALAGVTSDDDPEGLKANYPACSKANIYKDYRQMLEETEPDLAIISTRIDRIGPAAYEAAAAGCHCICEKPLAIEREKLEKHYQLLREKELFCIAMLDNAVHPVLDAAERLVQEGAIGNVALCNARKSYKFGTRPEWFAKRDIYGGTIPWVGIHALDFINAATGLHFVRVAAMQSNLVHTERRGCEDNCAISLKLNNGAHATVSVDYLRPESAPTHGDDWLRIVGGKGTIEAHMARNICTFVGEGGEHNIDLSDSKPFYSLILDDLAGGTFRRLKSLTARSFMLTDAALAARDSADKGQMSPVDRKTWHRDVTNRVPIGAIQREIANPSKSPPRRTLRRS